MVANSYWPASSFAATALLGMCLLVLMLAAVYRSRRLLLAGQARCVCLRVKGCVCVRAWGGVWGGGGGAAGAR